MRCLPLVLLLLPLAACQPAPVAVPADASFALEAVAAPTYQLAGGRWRTFRTPPPKKRATPAPSVAPTAAPTGAGRGFPATAPWATCYGGARAMGDLAKAASTFRIVNLDADPALGDVTPAQVAQLQAGGKNRVISYLNLGAAETWRDYWATAPAGFVPAGRNTKAHLGRYAGFPDETWMDLADPDWQKLIVAHVAPRLMKQGVDGFFFDNFELVEHGPKDANGPARAGTRQGGLDLVWQLRQKYPQALFVAQNATAESTRLGTTHGVGFATLLDGVVRESAIAPSPDAWATGQLAAWAGMGLKPGGRPFFVGTLDYTGGDRAAAKAAYDASRKLGFSPYVADASAGLQALYYWGF